MIQTVKVHLEDFTADELLPLLTAAAAVAEPGKSGFALLCSGVDALCSRAALIDGATKTIDMQYYLFHDDASGSWLAEKLIRAADRGVRVRILIDDVNLLTRDLKITLVDLHPNIEVRRFNPFTTRHRHGFLKWMELASKFTRANRRMHNKSLIVDEVAAVFGGRNVGDEYFEIHSELNFFDLDLLAVGPVVHDLRRSFDAFWESRFVKPLSRFGRARARAVQKVKRLQQYFRRLQKPLFTGFYAGKISEWEFPARLRDGTTSLVWESARVVADPPEKADDDTGGEPFLFDHLRKQILATERELRIVSPYFIPGRKGLETVQALRDRGVSMCVLTNSLSSNDLSLAHSGYCRYRVPVLENGVALFELKRKVTRSPNPERLLRWRFSSGSGASLHAKYFVFDRRTVFVGSFNLDPRSVFFNTELGVFIDSPELAAQLTELTDEAIESAAAYRLQLQAPRRLFGFQLPRRIEWVDEENGQVAHHSREPDTGFFRRLLIRLLTWLPIEKYL